MTTDTTKDQVNLDLRLSALDLALGYHANREASPEEALNTAEKFLNWLFYVDVEKV